MLHKQHIVTISFPPPIAYCYLLFLPAEPLFLSHPSVTIPLKKMTHLST